MDSSAHRKDKVLVVDDNDDFRFLIRNKLEKAFPIEVIEAINVSDAISKIKSHNFRLIVCDLMMPDGTGLEVHAYLENQSDSEAAFVLVTAGHQALSQSQLGKIVMVEKPNLDQLIGIVAFLWREP